MGKLDAIRTDRNVCATGSFDRVVLKGWAAVEWVSLAITLAGWCGFFLAAERCGRAVLHTTLRTAWRWLVGAGLAVCLMATTDGLMKGWPERTADYGWCLTSILLLCPPMAVLGARRPGVRVWSLFILCPMVAVLSWPIWTLLVQGSEWRGLSLEVPTVLGFVFVLVMGAGNYLGTRFAMSALLYFAGVLAIFLSCTGWSLVPEASMPAWRLGSILALAAAVLAGMVFRPAVAARHRVNRLWDDFRNQFGILWALRMVERINALALQEQWTIRLSLDGFPAESGRLTSNELEVEAACRWLFRRFVDEEWIARRLGPDSIETPAALATEAPLR